MTRRSLAVGGLLLVGLLARLAYASFMVDDAYIYARYARNLRDGEGLVFNPGEHVAAFTSPLYVLLLAGAMLLVSSPVGAAKAMALALYVAAHGVIVRLVGAGARRDGLSILAVGLFAIGGIPCRWWMSGMETPLYVVCAWSCLLAASRGQGFLSGLLGGMAVLARPDGLCLASILLLRAWLARRWLGTRPRVMPMLAGMAIPVVLWLLASVPYYEHATQSSVWSKLTASVLAGGTSVHLLRSYEQSLRTYAEGLVLLFPAMLAALLALRERRVDEIVFAAWVAEELAAYPLLMVPLTAWYLAPGFMGVWLLGAVGISRAAAALGLSGRWNAALVSLVAAGLLLCNGAAAVLSRSTTRDLEGSLGEMGRFVARHGMATDRVATGDIGILGWESRRPILDFGGLAHPEAMVAARDGTLHRFVLDPRPEWIVLSTTHMTTPPFRGISASPILAAHYQEVLRRPAFGMEYRLYRLRP